MQKLLDNIIVNDAELSVEIDAAPDRIPIKYKVLNEEIHRAIDEGYKTIILDHVVGQRFIGAAIAGEDIQIKIHGTPGNDLGIFMDGPTIEVFGNAEDQCGNTMNGGKIIIHGAARDIVGLSARGGSIYVRGDGGYRCGVHTKQYQNKRPVLVFGGRVRQFFGEYMAGGLLIALGLEIKDDGSFTRIENFTIAGESIGTGIHGGKIIFARACDDIPQENLGTGAKVSDLDEADRQELNAVLDDYCAAFSIDASAIKNLPFCKVTAVSKRPFAHNYCSKML
jgi:glutamate synthase domain-containing protein 3